MGTKRVAAAAAAVAGSAVAASGAGLRIAAARRRAGWPTRPPRRPPEPHWHSVTVNLPPERLNPDGRLPADLAELAELADLGDLVEVRMRQAPGGRGTELAARLRDGERSTAASAPGRLRGTDPVQRVRSALRRAKQKAETGEVLLADRSGTGERSPGALPADLLDRHGLDEGRL
jgi:hypothetical protein